MADAGLPFPRTLILPTSEPQAAALIVHLLNGDGRPVWVKRGDVHAETRADVVAAKEATVVAAIADFARRGIARVALQAHVPGPILKFYAVADGSFFHWYPADGAHRSTWTKIGCASWCSRRRGRWRSRCSEATSRCRSVTRRC